MISVRNVTKRFGDRTVLDDVSLEVGKGEILAVMGSSGGGKTTLLRCITGLIRPDSGSVVVAGIDVQKEPEEARTAMGMVFQAAALFDFMNVRENVLFGARRRRKLASEEREELVSELLATVGLEDAANLMPSELSGGMKKRVGIARALALKPQVMLYDEPITGLDPVTAYTIDQLIDSVRDQYQVTSVVVSHDVTSVFRLADRVAFLDDGKIVFLGTPKEFVSQRNEMIRDLVQKSQATSLDE